MARGDQVYVYREFFNIEGVYEHHGIDCGDGSVIHYRKPSEIIERTSVTTFSRNNPVYVRQYPVRYIADTTIQRAESRLGENQYNLLFNNCEHFATWCVTGISDSRQIRDFVPLLSRLNVDQLNQPLREAINDANTDKTPQLLDEALGDIRVAWDDIQPQYKNALAEMESWQKVAIAALKKDREDLARAALKRKRLYQNKAEKLESNLDQLAKMTENLLQNQRYQF
ncbi:MAG: lecithin retinol acyltransferase family protein [Microcoleaceae cyanobacterium]